jgi:multidrug efflux pump subunit AcrB
LEDDDRRRRVRRVSIIGLAMVPMAFFPDSDSSSSVLKIELPPGVLLSQTSQVSSPHTRSCAATRSEIDGRVGRRGR